MWGWDPSQGEGPVGGATPTLLPSEATPASPPISQPQPVLVPNVQAFKQQFQQQQSLLAHIKETLRENDADRSTKEKQLEMFANKLTQIKSRSKTAQKKTVEPPISMANTLQRRSSKENLAGTPVRPGVEIIPDEAGQKLSAKGKMDELKKRLEENKIKFEERTERGITEARKIESMVEQLRTQVQERDLTIHELQKTMDTPPARPRPQTQTVPKRPKEKPLIISKWTQTQTLEKTDHMKELEATIVDLQDTVKQQASVITARTQAVALLSEDLSKKGKSTVDELEDTRREMRDMQANFVTVESQLKADLDEKDNRLIDLEGKLQQLNALLTEKHTVAEAEKESLESRLEELNRSGSYAAGNGNEQHVCQLEKKVAELSKELDDSNKLSIRLKLDHKNKMKAANKALEKLKQDSDDKAEIFRLATKLEEVESAKSKLDAKIAELEEEKGNLLLSLLDNDELKASSLAEKQVTYELQNVISTKDQEIQLLHQDFASLDDEKQALLQTIEDQNILIDNLNARIQSLESECTHLEPFEIPGDAAAKQFDISNESVQGQIEVLVKEKKQLLEKLKNLSGATSAESSTFEKIEDISAGSEVVTSLHQELSLDVVSYDDSIKIDSNILLNLNRSLAEEKARSLDYKNRISELENTVALLGNSGPEEKGNRNLKNKIKKLICDLKNEKCIVQELNASLKAKEELIGVLREKLTAFEESYVGTADGDWEPDVVDFGETQQKCLSLESSLLQLTQQCEHLRKENIEVVHQLSGEKVRRIRAEEEAEGVRVVQAAAAALEARVAALEAMPTPEDGELEYANIVIASKDTEIFNLQSALADRTQILENLKEEHQRVLAECDHYQKELSKYVTEIGELRKRMADQELELENRQHVIKQLQETLAEKDEKIASLDEQSSSYNRRLSEVMVTARASSDECADLKQERHRLQVSLESAMTEALLAAQERARIEKSLVQAEQALQEAQSRTQDVQVLLRERDEALLKAEETEKVLQKTWTERNELIQSREVIYHRLSEVEHGLRMVSAERDEAVKRCDDVTKALDQARAFDNGQVTALEADLELKRKEVTLKQQELESMTVKAKKLAANLKKKTQTEKDLVEQLNSLNVEKEALLKQLGERQEMAEKWMTENNEKENILRQQRDLLEEKQLLIAQSNDFKQEKQDLMLRIDALSQVEGELRLQNDALLHEAQVLQSDKLALEAMLADERKALAVFQEKLTSALSENSALKDKFSEIEEKWTKEVSEKETIQILQTKTAGELSAMLQAFQLEEQENEALMTQRVVLMQEREQLITKYEEAQASVGVLQEENKHLSGQLEKLDLSLQDFLKKEVELSNSEEKYTQLMEENKKLGDELESLKQGIWEKDGELSNLKENNGRLVEENMRLADKLEHLNADLQDITTREVRNEEGIARLMEEKSALEQQLVQNNEALEQQHVQNNEAVTTYEARFTDSMKTISELETLVALLQEEKAKILEQWRDLEDRTKLETEQYTSQVAQLQKQVTNFNLAFDAEVQKNAALKAELEALHARINEKEGEISRLMDVSRVQDGKTERKKKKSVTFRTDDVDYIKELKGEVATLQKALVESDATVGELKAALVVKEKQSVPVVEEIVETAKDFNVNLFQNPADGDFLSHPESSDPFIEESLTWDDSWGAEGQLEEEHAISKSSLVSQDPEKIAKLESEVKALVTEKEVVLEDLRVLQVKYAKVIKKLKEQKLVIDRLQAELKSAKMSSGFGDLDAALMEELRAEMAKAENKESEVRKELDAVKQENQALLKRIDVLSAGNERFLELKERQDSEAALWQNKNAELRAQVADLQAQLLGPFPDETQLAQENRELKNLIEGLEWKVSELTEMIEEKDEELIRRTTQRDTSEPLGSANMGQLQSENTLYATTEKLRDVEQQLSMLAAENETLQSILSEQRLSSHGIAVAASDPVSEAPCTTALVPVDNAPALSQWFPTEPTHAFDFPLQHGVVPQEHKNLQLAEEIKFLKDQLNFKDQEIERLSNDLAEACLKLNLEKTKLRDDLHSKEEEVLALVDKLEATDKAYRESTSEIERLLSEEQLRSDSPLEAELANAKRSIESEKVRYEAIIKARDSELVSLRDSLGCVERDWDETQDRNDGTVQQLKAQLRELDAAAVLASEEKELELRELRAECAELRELCTVKDADLTRMRNELSSLSQEAELKERVAEEQSEPVSSDAQFNAAKEKMMLDEIYFMRKLVQQQEEELQQDKTLLEQREWEMKNVNQASKELKAVQQRLAVKEAELSELTQTSVSVESELLSRDAEVRELRAELISKEAEMRDLRSTLQALHDEVSQFRNFDKQLLDLRKLRATSSGEQSPGDWSSAESADLSARLQSDLDTALYMLHQRDVRCEELTFELVQLLEERDTLQLRLSTAIRQNEMMRAHAEDASSPPTQPKTEEGDMRHLADKISELHAVGYARDKNIQDDSQQRHREQMSLLAREARSKANTQVFDI